jgi:hypothetical protein
VVEIDLKNIYAQPPPPPSCTVEQAVARALAGEPSEAIIKLQAELDKLNAATESALLLGEKDELHIMSKKRRDAAAEKLKGLTGKTPAACSTSTAMKLALAKQEWMDLLKAATEGRAKGKEKALAKHQLDTETIDDQIARLQSLRTSLVETFAATEVAFKDAQTARTKWEKAIAEGMDTKIALATPIGGAAAAEPGAEADAGESNAPASPATVDYSDLALRADIQPDDIPTIDLKDVSSEHRKSLEAIWSFMQANPEGAPLPPLTYVQIGAGHVGALLQLLGDDIWRSFYETEVVMHTRLVPWQILLLTRFALKKFASELTANEATIKKMEKHVEDAKTAARLNLYSPF